MTDLLPLTGAGFGRGSVEVAFRLREIDRLPLTVQVLVLDRGEGNSFIGNPPGAPHSKVQRTFAGCIKACVYS